MKVGLIGAGRIGAFHAKNLVSMDGVTSLFIANGDFEKAKRVAKDIGAQALPDVSALLKEVDALVIAAATDVHAELIHAGAEAGLPIFCEKPISLDLGSTVSALKVVEQNGVALQIGFQRRFDPGYIKARRLVESGDIGRLYAARLATHDPHPAHDAYIRASGGLFRDMMIHDFDILRWTTGLEVIEVYARGNALTDNKVFPDIGDVDTAAALLTLEDGAVAVVTGLRHDPLGYDVRLELFGSGDSVVVGTGGKEPLRALDGDPEDGSTRRHEFFMDRFESAYRDEFKAFLKVARGEIASPCSGTDALEALRIAEAATLSLREGRPVTMNEIP
jgi:myo-inositol 2-dehydrogenase / D-chiro-inositol 1-dehydrogenase